MGGRKEQANEVRIISAKIVMNLQHINLLQNYTFISVFPFQVKKNAGKLGQAEQRKGSDFITGSTYIMWENNRKGDQFYVIKGDTVSERCQPERMIQLQK